MVKKADGLLAEVKAGFPYLFSGFGFKVACAKEIDHRRSLIVLRSSALSIKFIENLADIDFRVGDSSAPFIWEDLLGTNERVWYNPFLLIDFLRAKVDPDPDKLFGVEPIRSNEDILGEWAAWLEAEIEELAYFFRGGDSERRKAELVVFEQERKSRIHELFLEKVGGKGSI